MACFQGFFSVPDLSQLITWLASLVVKALGKLAPPLKALVNFIESVINKIIEAILGPLKEFIEFLAGMIVKLMEGASAVAEWLLEKLSKITDLIAKIMEILAKIADLPALVLEILAVFLEDVAKALAWLLALLNCTFAGLLGIWTFIIDFLKSMIMATIEAVLKPPIEGILKILLDIVLAAAGVIPGLINWAAGMAQLLIDIAEDIVGAIMKWIGIPSFTEILEMILGPIIEGIPTLYDQIVMKLSAFFDEVTDVIAQLIEWLMNVLSGKWVSDLGIVALLLTPLVAIIGFIGAILATFTPEQELCFFIPILDPLFG